MPRALWPAASLLLLSCAVPAAQGVHPGPLPTPIDPESGVGPSAADAAGYGGRGSPDGGPGYGFPVDPRETAGYGWGGGQWPSAPSFAPPDRGIGYAEPGYGATPQGGYGGQRGYWQWVPLDEPDASGYGSAPPPYVGYGDSNPSYGYAPFPPDSHAESYRGRFAPPAQHAYDEAPPGFGYQAAPGLRQDRPAPAGLVPDASGSGRDTGAARPPTSRGDAAPPAGRP